MAMARSITGGHDDKFGLRLAVAVARGEENREIRRCGDRRPDGFRLSGWQRRNCDAATLIAAAEERSIRAEGEYADGTRVAGLGMAAGRSLKVPEPDDAVVAACGKPLIAAHGEAADGAAAVSEGELRRACRTDDVNLGKPRGRAVCCGGIRSRLAQGERREAVAAA